MITYRYSNCHGEGTDENKSLYIFFVNFMYIIVYKNLDFCI